MEAEVPGMIMIMMKKPPRLISCARAEQTFERACGSAIRRIPDSPTDLAQILIVKSSRLVLEPSWLLCFFLTLLISDRLLADDKTGRDFSEVLKGAEEGVARLEAPLVNLECRGSLREILPASNRRSSADIRFAVKDDKRLCKYEYREKETSPFFHAARVCWSRCCCRPCSKRAKPPGVLNA